MGTDQRFSLRWNNYQSHLVTAFESLLEEKDFVDVTLGVEGRKLPAHKMLLSACSPYFRELLKGNPCQHPIIILRDIKYEDLFSLLQFMYNGEVNVAQDQLNSFLKSAESLKIRGLTDNDSGGGGGGAGEDTRTAPPPPSNPSNRDRDLHPPPVKRKRPYPEQPSPHHAPMMPSPKRAPSIPTSLPPTHSPQQPTPRPEPVKQEIIELGDDHYGDGNQYDEVDADVGGGATGFQPSQRTYQEDEGAMVPHGEAEEGMDGGEGAQGFTDPFGGAPLDYICDVCSKTFRHPESFASHRKYHNGQTTCPHCQTAFSTVGTLNRHIRKVHKAEPYQPNEDVLDYSKPHSILYNTLNK